EKSLEFYLKAHEIQTELGQTNRIKQTNQVIADLYSQRKEFRKSIEYYEATLKILNDSTDLRIREQILPKLGSEYLQFNDWERASTYLLQALRLNRRTNNTEGLVLTLNGLARLNLNRGNWRLADSQAEEAYSLLDSSSEIYLKLENYNLQKEIDSTRGNFEQAYLWQSRYFQLKQNLEAEQKKQATKTTLAEDQPIQIEEYPTEFGDKKNDIDPNSLKRNRLYMYILGAALLIACTLLIVSFIKGSKHQKETIVLERDLKSIKKTNEELKISIEELEEKNTVKDRLFSIVSHDLKDSISSIKAFIDLLREDSLTREEFYDLIPELSENANNASLLLFNLLNWSKSQLQNLESKPELFNIQDIFRDKLQLIQQRVEDKRIAIIDESQRDFAYADKSMIEIVIQNFLTNAVKFSRVGDIITISNRDKDGKALIIVEDTGVGISEENLSKLFQKNSFTTIGTKNEKGTGLGLTICKELVELNNGKIWVESTQNVGTKFFVELPKSKPEITS
ncbi:tetratricopeptide repeat-containing sensor histidine kinase, partial [Aegicerativicinus sediminis]